MELIGKLASNDTSNIGIIPSASKYISIQFSDQYIKNLSNKEIWNGYKGSTKIQKIESLFKYQSRIYNIERNSDVNHRGMKMRCNNKRFPSLHFINSKTSPYGSKIVLRHNHYPSYPKLCPGIVAIVILAQLYYLLHGIQKLKNQLIDLDMVEYIIASALKLLVVTIPGL